MSSYPAFRLCGRLFRPAPIFTAPRTAPLTRLTPSSPQVRMASNTVEPCFAEGEDAAQLGADTQRLLQQQGWALDADGMGVTKTFYFKSYFKAVVSVANGYSPSERNGYNSTSSATVWSTVSPKTTRNNDPSRIMFRLITLFPISRL